MSGYTVSEVARLSGVSVRTLHHYDEVGLLRPACVGANGYRYYDREGLLRLQQILLHRELGFSLEEIGRALDAKGFDQVAALQAHRARLQSAIKRHRDQVRTIDRTLAELKGKAKMDDEAMYRGFDPGTQAAHERELIETHGPRMKDQLEQAKAGQAGWGQGDFDAMQAERDAIEAGMAKALSEGQPADGSGPSALMRRQHAWVSRSWNRQASAEAFAGLGRMYVDDPRFRQRYDAREPGLAEYMSLAMAAYAQRHLA